MTVPFSFGPGNPFARDKTAQGKRKRLSVAELLAILPEHALGLEEPERLPPIPIRVAADATRRARAPRSPAAPSIGPAPTRAALKSQEEVVRQTALANAKLRPKALSTAGDLLIGPETMRLLTEDGSLTPGVGVETLLTAAPFIGPAKRALKGMGKAGIIGPSQVPPKPSAVKLSPEIIEAAKHTPGARVAPEGLYLNLRRFQKSEQAGSESPRGGVFYSPKGTYQERHFRNTSSPYWYGGDQAITGETLLERPLVIKGSVGGRVPERAIEGFLGKDATNELRYEVEALANSQGGFGNPPRAQIYEEVWNLLEKYGGDVDLAGEIVERGRTPNFMRYMIQENIAGNLARKAGYDAIVGQGVGRGSSRKGKPFITEVFDLRESHYPTPGRQGELRPEFAEEYAKRVEGGGYIGPRAAATVMPSLTGAGVGASVGAAEDEENRLRGALMGGAAGALGGAALGHGADALGWKLRQGRINRAIDRAEEPNRAAMRAIMNDEELLAGQRAAMRAGNERGAIGYSYQTKTPSRLADNPWLVDAAERKPSRFSALDKFIREGEFGRKTPKPLQQWLGYLRKNVGKGGYTKEELEGYLAPAIEKKAAQVRGERNPYKGPRGVFTRDQLLSQFDFSPLTLQEDVYGLPKRQTAREVAWTRLTMDNRVLSRTEAEAFLDDPYVSGLVVGRERSRFSGGKNPQRLLEKFNDAILKLDAEALSWQHRAARHRANPPVASTFSLEELEWFAKDRREMAEYLHEKLKRLGLSQVGSKKLPPATVDALPLSGAPKYDTYRPKGRKGTNYREHVVSAPDLIGNREFRGGHWTTNVPNAIAHARTEDRGAKTLHVFEMQSDWLQAARDKGIRDPKRIAELEAIKDKADAKMVKQLERLNKFKQRSRAIGEQRARKVYPEQLDAEGRVPRSYSRAEENLYTSQLSRYELRRTLEERYNSANREWSNAMADFEAERSKVNPPPIPNETQAGVRMLTKSLLTRAAKEGYDKVSFAQGIEVADMFNLRDAATRLELVPIESKVDAFQRTHSLRVTSKRSGQVRSFDVGPGASHSLEEYVGKGNAKLLREKGSLDAADFYDAGRAGIGDYYDEIVPNTVKGYVKELTGEPAQWVVPKTGSPYLKMTPKLKAAILAGQTLPGLAGVALLSEEDRKLLGIEP